jgi:hypothetical protein
MKKLMLVLAFAVLVLQVAFAQEKLIEKKIVKVMKADSTMGCKEMKECCKDKKCCDKCTGEKCDGKCCAKCAKCKKVCKEKCEKEGMGKCAMDSTAKCEKHDMKKMKKEVKIIKKTTEDK